MYQPRPERPAPQAPTAPALPLAVVGRASYVNNVTVNRVSPDEFRRVPLEAHAVLGGVPLYDVTCVDLPGGGQGRSLGDVRALMADGPSRLGGRAVRALFALRRTLGRIFGWDRAPQGDSHESDDSYVSRIPAALTARSTVPTGSRDGMFRVLYELPNEAVVEGRNKTAHALLCSALVPMEAGYRLYWAVYVMPVSAFTAFYMALIEPFRRIIVYPSILGGLRRAWESAYPTAK
jgi:Protein of unknown function (DUF2867)